MKLALRIYTWALRLYPRDFRDQHSQAMLETYTDALKDAALRERLPAFHRHTTLDLISSLLHAHLQGVNMTIWMRRLLIASSLIIGLSGLMPAAYIWSESSVQFPVTIHSDQTLEPRVALWYTITQWTSILATVQWMALAVFAFGLIFLGILSMRHVTLERRWAVDRPFLVGLFIALIVAIGVSTRLISSLLSQMAFTLMFALGWIALAFSIWLKPPPRAAPDLPSPRV